MYNLKDYSCKDIIVGSDVYEDLYSVFSKAFSNVCIQQLELYLNSQSSVLLVYDNGIAIGLCFYTLRRTKKDVVLHFSMSGKNPDAPKGLQFMMGNYIYFNNLKFLDLFKRVNFTTVSNNPRSYLNMKKFLMPVFPDVSKSSIELTENYFKLADRLGFGKDINPRGILKNRTKLVFDIKIKKSELIIESLDKPALDFLDYIDRDTSHGVFVMVSGIPLIDIPMYYIRKLFGRINNLYKIKPV